MIDDGFIQKLKTKVSHQNSLDTLNKCIEFNGCLNSINQHIYLYVTSLTMNHKLSLIAEGLSNNITVSHETLQYESINTICQEIIIGKLI
jgi:hypothetical protein